MPHQLSQQGADLIKHLEGLRLDAYQDSAGVLTIGYGHTGDVYAGQKISEAEADADFLKDIGWAVDAVNSAVHVALNQAQFDALVSFTFNVGGGAFRSSTLLKKLNAGDYAAVPVEMGRWVYAGDKKGMLASFVRWAHLGSGKEVSKVLKNRRDREGKLFATGAYS
ncbi:lysozyme [Sneathiella sp.]|uniref:lysozyme n=1 Tax=Sneathiella sp. TaxID=1964365 RepID=UPI002FDFC4C0